MVPIAAVTTLDGTLVEDTGLAVELGVSDDEFELDMRVVEATTPLVTMMCSTNDGCGNTCNGSTCSTGSNDPF